MKHRPDLFYQRTDRRAALVLVGLAAVCTALVVWLGGSGGGGAPAVVTDTVYASVPGGGPGAHADMYVGPVEERRTELFAFDPNTADSTALMRLGLRPWQVRAIYRYRARGGVYRLPDDFARLYGLTAGEFRRLRPYITISPDFMPAATLVADSALGRDTLRYPVKLKAGESIVLNTADTAELRRVPGIGAYFARAIVRYGERLGGYVSTAQLDEIDGFPEEAKPYFTISDPHQRRMNLNTLPMSSLRRHPYISFYQAKAIVDYRRQHGRLQSLDDLRLCRDFTPEAIRRLEPYVEF